MDRSAFYNPAISAIKTRAKTPQSGLPNSVNKLSLGFQSLNIDFDLPPVFKKIKKLGKGAYGKVMHIVHVPTNREYACKRFEWVCVDDQRARRLIRELNILKELDHPCLNKIKCILPPWTMESKKDEA